MKIILDEILSITLNHTIFSPDQIIRLFELVGELGYVILLKKDGIRKENHYSVVILSSLESEQKPVRVDASELSNALKKAINKFLDATKAKA